MARYVIGDELQHGSDHFRESTGNRDADTPPAADRSQLLEKVFQRDTFAAEDVPMSNLTSFHCKDQARRDITHVYEVHHEIEIELKALT